MPRKTGYKTRSASSTLVLGNPDLGTREWDTEYDVEFCDVPCRQEHDRGEDEKQMAKASLRTPRSLKKGYVSGQDYEKLDEQYNQAVMSYRDLQLQVAALEQRLAAMQRNEHLLLQAVEEQQSLINTLRQQIAAMNENLTQLTGGVERNKSLLTVISNVQPQHEGGLSQQDMASVSKRLEAVEAKISDMVDTVVAISRAQEAMIASGSTLGTVGHHTRREGLTGRQSNDGRRPSSSGGRRHQGAERIERLPNPFKLSTRSTFWKP